jgi:hypothetical protein
MNAGERNRRYRERRKATGAPTIKAADRELRFSETLRATLPPVKPEPPAWWKRQRKAPLEIRLRRVTHYA